MPVLASKSSSEVDAYPFAQKTFIARSSASSSSNPRGLPMRGGVMVRDRSVNNPCASGVGHLPVREVRQDLPETGPRSRQPRHHRARWNASDLRDLFVGETLLLAKDEHLTKGGRKLPERLFHRGPAVISEQHLFRIG